MSTIIPAFPATAPKVRSINPYRIRLRDRVADAGYDSLEEYLESECMDSVMEALCVEGCQVEPDGRCEHGCPSPLLAAGLI